MNCRMFVFFVMIITSFKVYINSSLSTEYDSCFDEFSQRTSKAAHEYAGNYEDCQSMRNNRHALFTREKETEREQIEAATALICESMKRCNEHEADFDFFQCHANIGLENTHTMLDIHLNSSAAYTELSEKYEESEKIIILCTIEARRTYTKDTKDAFSDLKKCLEL